jgi:hypothetical protein
MRSEMVFCGLLGLGLIMAYFPMIFSGLRLMQTDPGDTRLNNYILEHCYLWLTGSPIHSSFWDPPFFYPVKNVLAYGDVLLGSAPIYWLFRALELFPDTAYQFWMFAVSTLNFAAAYLWLRRCWRFSEISSAVGAFVFSFGSPRVVQTGHQQLLPHFFSIGALYAATRLFQSSSVTGGAWWVIALLACLVGQIYAGFYLGWFLAFGLGVAGLMMLLLRDYRQDLLRVLREHRASIGVSVFVAALALAPLAIHYLAAGTQVGYRGYDEVSRMVPTIQSWIFMGGESWLYGWQRFIRVFQIIPTRHEQIMGIGLITSLMAFWGLYEQSNQRWARLLLGWSIVVFFMVTSFYPGVSLWRLLFYFIPLANTIRAVSRICLLMLIPASVGVAFFLECRIRGSKASSRAKLAALALVAVVVLEQGRVTPYYDKMRDRAQVHEVASRIQPQCGYFLFTPWVKSGQETPWWKLQIDAMWAGIERQIPTINGNAGNFPPNWPFRDNQLRTVSDEFRVRDQLSAWISANGLDPMRVCWLDPFVEP